MSEPVPAPKKRRWLGRALWTLVILVAVAILVRIIAGIAAQNMLNGRLDALRAAGEPIRMTEVAPPEVAPEKNAAVLYEQAFVFLGLLPDTTTARIATLSEMKRPLSEDNLAEARKLLDQSDGALRLIREGAPRPQYRFNVKYDTDPSVQILMPHLSKVRGAARLLALSAQVNLADGKADAAAEDCLAMFRVSRSVQDEPILISCLVEIASLRIAEKQLEATLDRSDPSPSPAELEKLAAEIASIDLHATFHRTMKGERCFGIDTFRFVLEHPEYATMISSMSAENGSSGLASILIRVARPLIVIDEARYIDDMSRLVEMSGRPVSEWRTGWKKTADDIVREVKRHMLTRPFSGMLLPALGRAAEATEAGIVRLDLASTALALRRYRVDHREYPETLASLVPQYLPAVPADPFSPTGSGPIYRRDGAGFLLYSVGVDGKDDGGVEGSSWNEGDIVFRSSR